MPFPCIPWSETPLLSPRSTRKPAFAGHGNGWGRKPPRRFKPPPAHAQSKELVLSQSWGRTEPPQGWSALRARYTKTVGAANRASRDARTVVLLRLKVDLHLIDIPAADLLRDLREKSPRPCTLRVLPPRPTRNHHESARKCSIATECRRKAEYIDCKIQQKMHCGRCFFVSLRENFASR